MATYYLICNFLNYMGDQRFKVWKLKIYEFWKDKKQSKNVSKSGIETLIFLSVDGVWVVWIQKLMLNLNIDHEKVSYDYFQMYYCLEIFISKGTYGFRLSKCRNLGYFIGILQVIFNDILWWPAYKNFVLFNIFWICS